MIGYYAHDHGSGHLNYARIFSNEFRKDLTVFTSASVSEDMESAVIELPTERPDGTQFQHKSLMMPDYVHYSPVGQRSILNRSSLLLQEVEKRDIQLMIVDVSVEIAALCKVSSLPYAYVRLPGLRNDQGHREAFKGALFLLAYFPECMEHEDTPDWIKEKTIYLGFFSKYHIPSPFYERKSHSIESVSVISGSGGNEKLNKSIPFIAERFSDCTIEVVGRYSQKHSEKNLVYSGFKNNLISNYHHSDLIIGNCGLNLVSEVFTFNRPFIAIPEERPYDEQQTLFTALKSNGFINGIEDLNHTTNKELLEQLTKRPKLVNDKAPALLHRFVKIYRNNRDQFLNACLNSLRSYESK